MEGGHNLDRALNLASEVHHAPLHMAPKYVDH